MNILEAAEYLETTKKNVRPFATLTPDKNRITGFIYMKASDRLGSLIIDSINAEPCLQYVQGMPKIGYLHRELETVDPRTDIHILDKLDGMNIVQYPLIVEGEVVEVIPKTRREPVAMESIRNKVNEVAGDNYIKAVEKEKLSFAYELYGINNPIKGGVQYFRVDPELELEMELITVLDQGKALKPIDTSALAMQYDIPMVQHHFSISRNCGKDTYRATPTEFLWERFGEWLPLDDDTPLICTCNMETLYDGLEVFYEQLNKNFAEAKGTEGLMATEGSVWHIDAFGQTLMIKDKALKVRERHIQIACGIDMEFINKALAKAQAEIEDFSKKNFPAILEYVRRELLEEFPEEMVMDRKVEQKTQSALGRMTHEIKIDERAKRFVDAVHEEVGEDADLGIKMRTFAQLFPEDKKDWGGKVFQYFTKRAE